MARRRTALLAAMIAVSLSLWATTLVAAHAALVRSDPPDLCTSLAAARYAPHDARCAAGVTLDRPPATVRLSFTEPVAPVGGGITVISPTGAHVEAGPAHIEGAELSVPVAAMAPGTYQVDWQVVSDDTHPERGRFAFSVTQPTAMVGTAGEEDGGALRTVGLGLQVGARWLHFVGFALGFGTFAFELLVLAPLGLTCVARRTRTLMQWGILVLLVAEPFALLAQTASLSSGASLDVGLAADALATSFGRVAAQRLGAGVLLWVLLGVMAAGMDGTAGAAARWIALALGGSLALVDGEASHAIGTDPAWLGMAMNTLHVGAMGIWVGGLMSLLVVWRQPRIVAARFVVLRRFGVCAAGSFVVLVATGTVMAAEHLATPADLFTSSYGHILGAKLFIVLDVAFVALAGWRVGHSRPGANATSIRRWWALEIVVLSGVLMLAGLLVSLAPPR